MSITEHRARKGEAQAVGLRPSRLIIPSAFDARLNLVVSRHASAIYAPHSQPD